jgi:hypothetical protein
MPAEATGSRFQRPPISRPVSQQHFIVDFTYMQWRQNRPRRRTHPFALVAAAEDGL